MSSHNSPNLEATNTSAEEKAAGLTKEESLNRSQDAEAMYDATNEPKRWYNQGLRVGGKQLPPFNSSMVQLIMVSFVCFLCPGMFNALSGTGGAGLPKEYFATAANANVALYCTFATIGFLSGTIINRLGVKWTIAIGGLGYALNSASYLCFNHTHNTGFVIASGAILGVCAACLWAGQGVIIMAYPTESEKGKYLAIFWMIFNLGAVIGAIIPLAQSADNTSEAGATDGTYAAFLALMIVGAIVAFLLMPTASVIKSDNTKVIVKSHPTWTSEIIALGKILLVDWHIIFLFPMFISANWFYTYQFNEYNGARFNLRTRSLNSLVYWAAQILGAAVWGWFLDRKWFSRPTHAKILHSIVFVFTMVVWGGGYAAELSFHRKEKSFEWMWLHGNKDTNPYTTDSIDWTDGGYGGWVVLYIFYGVYDAVWQTYTYWLMGALSNSSRKIALYAGFYKGLQSAGAAVVWRLDAIHIPFRNVFASTWALCGASLLLALPTVLTKIQPHADLEADAQFTDNIHADELAHRIGLQDEKEFYGAPEHHDDITTDAPVTTKTNADRHYE